MPKRGEPSGGNSLRLTTLLTGSTLAVLALALVALTISEVIQHRRAGPEAPEGAAFHGAPRAAVDPMDHPLRPTVQGALWRALWLMLPVGLIVYGLARSIGRRLSVVSAASERIGGGDLDVLVPEGRPDEIGMLSRSFNAMALALRRRTDELGKSSDESRRSERLALFGQLAGGVGHELRNPLGVMKNSIYYLRLVSEDMDAKVKEHLGIVDDQITLSTRIVNDLLDYKRTERADRTHVDLRSVLAAALATAKIPDSVEVRQVIDEDSVMIDADAGQLERLLGAVLRNAIQAMPGGGRLALSCRPENGFAVASVTDTGIGISPDKIEEIFEPLYSGRARGIGLGLALARRYAKNNDGSLDCHSILGEGSTFLLRLPLLEEEVSRVG